MHTGVVKLCPGSPIIVDPSTLSKTVFKCRSGDFVSVIYVMDGDPDCRDHTDEGMGQINN